MILLGLALASAGGYLLLSALRGENGFALDDAWIHQVYARNLATRGEFSFFPGQPSAGSTSPLWTILLATGYLLHLDFRIWSYFVGTVLLAASAIIAGRLAERLGESSPALRVPGLAWLVPLFMIFEWHLAWSAVSGMEIPLFVFLSVLLCERMLARERPWLLGIIAGLLVLTRPEGVVLVGLVGIGLLLRGGGAPATSRAGAAAAAGLAYGIGLAALAVPYGFFNWGTSGAVLPNTFYAKAAEYAILFERVSLPARWGQLTLVPWVGAQILLLPGWVFVVVKLARARQWLTLFPAAWLLVLPSLYALRLPVTYQHGRYEMPVIPFVAVYGVWGTVLLLRRIPGRVVRGTWAGATAALVLAFWYLGAAQYATDVEIINCEMVQTAQWVAANAPADALVAAHDIGALGYYYDRPFIDLAGLVTPEVIPFMRDQGRLRDYLLSRRATLAVFFPDWYPELTRDPLFSLVRRQDCPVTRGAGGTDMGVYSISSSN